MKINIQYENTPVSEPLGAYVRGRLQKLFNRYDDLIRAEVTYKLKEEVDGKGNICDIELSLPGPRIFATSREDSFEAAAKETVLDLQTQLEKRKGKAIKR